MRLCSSAENVGRRRTDDCSLTRVAVGIAEKGTRRNLVVYDKKCVVLERCACDKRQFGFSVCPPRGSERFAEEDGKGAPKCYGSEEISGVVSTLTTASITSVA